MAGKMKRRVPPPPPAEADDGPSLDPHELDMMVSRTIRFGDVYRFKAWIDQMDSDNVYMTGSVNRSSSHYVHEKTTDFEWEFDFYGATKGGMELEDDARTEGEKLMNAAEEDIDQIVIDINRTIYKSLEQEYEYQTSDEVVIDGIQANEYEFDEDGNRSSDGEFQYGQLRPEAQATARNWFREGCCDDSYWSETTIDDWKAFLVEMGFGYDTDHVEIAFSGFWSQGDGASFTCKTFDFPKFCLGLANPELRQRIYDAS